MPDPLAPAPTLAPRTSGARTCGSSSRPRRAAHPSGRAHRESGTRPRSRSARRALKTSTSRPSARAARASSTAAALLLTTSDASAPVTPWSSFARWTCREPRVPASRSYSRFEYPPPTSTTRSSAARASGARPRFVWISTPVALRTRRKEGRWKQRAPRATLDDIAGVGARPNRLPGRVQGRPRGRHGGARHARESRVGQQPVDGREAQRRSHAQSGEPSSARASAAAPRRAAR